MEIAIKVLRQAGYHSHAVFLAEKHSHHEWYLKIQLEDLKVKEFLSEINHLQHCGDQLNKLLCFDLYGQKYVAITPICGIFNNGNIGSKPLYRVYLYVDNISLSHVFGMNWNAK